jgi:hypothetical protein
MIAAVEAHMKRMALVPAGLAVLALLSACNPNGSGSRAPDHLSVVSVSGAHAAGRAAFSLARSLDNPIVYGHIDSGPPTSLTFTLYQIQLEGTFGGGGGIVQSIWESTAGQAITVSGSGAIDLTGVEDIANLPVGTVTGVKLVISPRATMSGQLEGAHVAGTTVPVLYTKAASSYDALTKTGGAASYADFTTGPAEPVDTYFNGGDNLVRQEIGCPVSYTLAAGATPSLTILFDISRALRFYDGLDPRGAGGGPSPSDLYDKAYFFSHSVLTNSIVCFFGEAGSIQGYQTLYDNTAASATSVIPGWMTLVFDAAGDIQSGILIGDDDNAGTVLKGLVQKSTATTTSAGVYDFTYDISNVTVTGFAKVTTVDAYVDAPWLQNIPPHGGGTARYTLKLQL